MKEQEADIWDWIRFVPSDEDIIFVGVISAIATFIIGYLGIHVLFRLVRWLIEGFKTEN